MGVVNRWQLLITILNKVIKEAADLFECFHTSYMYFVTKRLLTRLITQDELHQLGASKTIDKSDLRI